MDKEISSQEDVKQEEVKEELSIEEYKKLKEIDHNKTIALQQEREEKQSLKERLAEFEKKEAEELEKEKKKKGQYEEILAEKEELIKTLSEKASAYDNFITKQQEKIQEELKTKLEAIPEDVLEANKDFLDDLSDEKKIKFLDKLINDTKKEDFSSKPNSKKEDNVDDFAELQAKVKNRKATPTERATFLTLLQKKWF